MDITLLGNGLKATMADIADKKSSSGCFINWTNKHNYYINVALVISNHKAL